MSRKTVLLSLVILLGLSLSGCIVQANSFNSRMDAALHEAQTQELNQYISHDGLLFDYYLPITIGKKTSTMTSVLMQDQNQLILMTLDVVSIMNSSLENQAFTALSNTAELYHYSGTTTNFKGFDLPYTVDVKSVDTKRVWLNLKTPTVVLSSILPLASASEIAYDMVRIARSVVVDKQLVVANFSNKEVIQYQKETLDMFTQLAPESGTVMDMIDAGNDNFLDDPTSDAGPEVIQ